MEASFASRLKASLKKHAARSAVEGRSRHLTYGELDRASEALAGLLRDAGVKAGDIVPLMLQRSIALVLAQVALVRVGAAYAPIDQASPEARQRAMLDQLNAPLTITDHSSENSEFLSGATLNVESFVDEQMYVTAKSDSSSDSWFESSARDLACVMFTSGTTGQPKGVMVPQSGIARLLCDADYAEFPPDSRWAFLSSPAFDPNALEIWAPLLNGGCCVVQEIAKPSLDDIAAYIIGRNITDMWLTSSLFNAMVDDWIDAFPGVRQLMVGGERVSPRHARAVLERYPDIRLINGYGPTENTTFTLCHDIVLADCDNERGIPIGKAIRGTTVRVVSADDTLTTVHGGEGELLAGGVGVALGYLNAPELTAKKFVQLDGERWYRTGDIVRQRGDGVYEFLGRVDRQVKLQGNRIELDDIERALASFPGIALCAVLVRGTAAENRNLVAVYTGIHVPPPVEEVLRFLNQQLPPPAVPSRLIPVDRIPLSTTGKIDQVALATLVDSAMAGSRRVDASPSPNALAPTASECERQLMAIWQQYLPTAHIDRTTNFLCVGGTSLLALQVSAQVRRKMGKNLTPIDVLRLPVLADQARAIESASVFDVESIVEGGSDRELILTQTQRSMLSAMQLDATGAAYLVHVALRFEHASTHTEQHTLKHAFTTLASRHPALRMTLGDTTDFQRAQVRPTLPDGWWRVHAPIDTTPSDLHWPSALMQIINTPLNLAHDGVMRIDYWPVADGSQLVVWTINHIAIDDASIDRALVELDALLNHVYLEPVFGSPMGFAAFERAWTNRDALRDWPNVLIDALHGRDSAMPHAPGRGDEVALVLPNNLSAALQAACDRWGMTPFVPLLLAYGRAVQQVFGEQNRFINTPFSRRTEFELIEPIGCLLDVNLVEAGRRPGEAAAVALARVQLTALTLQRLQFLPHRNISEAIARTAPDVANQLSAFAFTWRINPSRNTALGGTPVRVLRVPQQSALFGLSLHAWVEDDELHCSVEAMAGLLRDGRAHALGDAFVKCLGELCAIQMPTSLSETEIAVTRDNGIRTTGDRAEQLQHVWSRWVGISPDAVADSSHFLRSGGNSLTVMRMMAHLRREHGLRIEPADFLARPTFEHLCELAGEGVSWSSEYGEMVGPVDAPNVVVFFPGDAGPTIGAYNLAREVQRQLGADYVACIVDLDTMLLRAPTDSMVEWVRDRILEMLTELGWHRIVALAGYSSGGIVATEIARLAPEGIRPTIWLLDTYAPMTGTHEWLRTVRQTGVAALARKTVAPFVRPLLTNKRIATALGTHVRTKRKKQQPAPIAPHEIKRREYRDQLHGQWHEETAFETHLVQAMRTLTQEKLLWRGETNGFDPRQYLSFQVHQVDGDHTDVRGPLAPVIAKIIVSRLKQTKVGVDL